MLQAWAALLGAVVTVAGCYAAGALLVDWSRAPLRRSERFPLAFVLGAACLHLAIFAVLALKIAYKPLVIAVPVIPILLAFRSGAWRNRGEPGTPVSLPLKLLFGTIFALYTLLYFFHAWSPENSADGASYHLGFVARYLRAHGFERILTNMYASLSAGVEMLYIPAFAIGRHSAAALVHFAFTVSVALAMFAYGRRIGHAWAGAVGALLVYLSPVVGMDGTTAYIDLAVAAIAFAVFYWLELWDTSRDARLLIPVGLLAGYAFAAKYTAFVMVPYAIGFVLWRSRKLKPALTVCALATVTIAPWLMRDWIYYQNPVAPFANTVFRNPHYKVSFEEDYRYYLRQYSVENKWALPLEVTVRGQKTTGALGATLLAAPLALLALRYRAGRRLLVPGVLLGALYFTNIGTRFLIPCLPFISLAMALALANIRVLLAAMAVFHALACWPSILRTYAGPYVWALETKFLWKQALRRVPQDDYLRATSGGYVLARMIETYVPAGEKVLTMNGVPDSYTTREVAVSFQSGLNLVDADILAMGWDENAQPSHTFVFKFPERSVRRLRVVQTGQGEGSEQWNVHELGVFNHDSELPRLPEWRLSAWPNPWEVQMAFDNSVATRWRSWETAAPGMHIDIDFGKAQALDEVRVATSGDHVHIALRLEEQDQQGRWIAIAENPELRLLPVNSSVRLAATAELHARGVNYIMMHDAEWGARDLADDPEAWGLKPIARSGDVMLYQVIQ